MELIVGLSALFVGLVSLWLVGETNKKASSLNDAFLKAHVNGLKSAIEGINVKLNNCDKTINELAVRVNYLEDIIKSQKPVDAETLKTLAALEISQREKNSANAPKTAGQNPPQNLPGANRSQAAGRRGA